MKMNAFITGSHAYGMPGKGSDVDLVLLTNQATLEKLIELCDEHDNVYDDSSSASIRFHGLNLIVHTDKRMFDVWKDSTEKLTDRRPVSRKDAVNLIREELSKV